MDKMIEVLERNGINWQVTFMQGDFTTYVAWIVTYSSVYHGNGETPLEAIQDCLDQLMRHSRQSGWEIAPKGFIDTLRSDLGSLSPR